MSSRGGDAITTIPVRKATRDRLKRHGGKGETYDAILNRLMDSTPLPGQRSPGAEPRALAEPRPLVEPRPLADFEVVEAAETPEEGES